MSNHIADAGNMAETSCFPNGNSCFDAVLMSEEQQQLTYACLDDARSRIDDPDLCARLGQVMRLMTGRY